MGIVEELLRDNKCCICKKLLSINNLSGYCTKHTRGKEMHASNEKFRLAKLASNKRYYQKNRDQILAKKATNYNKRKSQKEKKMGECNGDGECPASLKDIFKRAGHRATEGVIYASLADTIRVRENIRRVMGELTDLVDTLLDLDPYLSDAEQIAGEHGVEDILIQGDKK